MRIVLITVILIMPICFACSRNALKTPQIIELTGGVALLLMYLISVTRRFETTQRTYVYTRTQQTSERQATASEKARAEWLLRNVIPSFVVAPLMKNKHYAKDYENVGVAFLTITNYLKRSILATSK